MKASFGDAVGADAFEGNTYVFVSREFRKVDSRDNNFTFVLIYYGFKVMHLTPETFFLWRIVGGKDG